MGGCGLKCPSVGALLVGPGPAAAGAHRSSRRDERARARARGTAAAKRWLPRGHRSLRAPRQTRRAVFGVFALFVASQIETHRPWGVCAGGWALEERLAAKVRCAAFASVLQYASFDSLWPRQTQRASR